MKKSLWSRRFFVLILAGCLAHSASADEPEVEEAYCPVPRETLTDNWFGFGEQLESRGLGVSLSATQIYQQNVHGGISTHRRSGRYSGSFDLEAELDLETAWGIEGGSLFFLAEGSWSEGINDPSVGAIFGVNDDAGGYRSFDVTELHYQQSLADGAVKIRLGKIDLTGGFECRGCAVAFDGNNWANDETGQFLNSALVNNPTIPFPDNGLGIVVYWQPTDFCYIAAGVADAQADAREGGFNTTFNGEDYFFYVLEAGITPHIDSANGPLQGAYRLGIWYDPQPKDRLDGGGTEQDDVGAYVSLGQVVWRENDEEDDCRQLALFGRCGLADDELNEVNYFWSVGGQYQGLISSRKQDVLGCGIGIGHLSNDGGFSASHETVVELYYNAQVAPWLNVTPSFQYVLNPGGDATVDDAAILAVRVQLSF